MEIHKQHHTAWPELAVVIIFFLKDLKEFSWKLFKTFYFKLLCDNAFLSALLEREDAINCAVYTVNTHTDTKSSETVLRKESESFLSLAILFLNQNQ